MKGRAFTWFYSKAEYLILSIEDLLEEMKQIFDLHPGKLSLKKEFESRVWKADEQFCDYYHEKDDSRFSRVVPIEDEFLDYLVEGVTDMRLQNQARIMNFRSKIKLLKVFEKISLESKRSSDPRQKNILKSSTGQRCRLPEENKVGKVLQMS